MSFIYIIDGYKEMKTNGDLIDVTKVRVTADNGNEALEKAKVMVEKENYRISEVIELEQKEVK